MSFKSSYLNPFLTILTIAVIIACTSILFWKTSECLSRYLEYETKAIITVMKTGKTTFLSFTICPSFDDAYNKSIFLQYDTNKSLYVNDGYFIPNTTEFYDTVTYNLTEILSKIGITTGDTQRSKIWLNLSHEMDANYVTKYDQTFGKCFSIEINPNVTKMGITKIEFYAKLNIYIYLHHPGQYMDVDSKSKVYANLGKKYFIDLMYELSNDTLGHSSNIPCDMDMNRKYDDCIYSEFHARLYDKFGCTVPFLPSNESLPICNKNGQEVLNYYDMLSTSGTGSLCPTPCATMQVFLGLPFDGHGPDNEAYIKLYTKSTAKVKKMVYDYTILSLLAEIGGYTGLLLGVSVLNLNNMVNKIIIKLQEKFRMK